MGESWGRGQCRVAQAPASAGDSAGQVAAVVAVQVSGGEPRRLGCGLSTRRIKDDPGASHIGPIASVGCAGLGT